MSASSLARGRVPIVSLRSARLGLVRTIPEFTAKMLVLIVSQWWKLGWAASAGMGAPTRVEVTDAVAQVGDEVAGEVVAESVATTIRCALRSARLSGIG